MTIRDYLVLRATNKKFPCTWSFETFNLTFLQAKIRWRNVLPFGRCMTYNETFAMLEEFRQRSEWFYILYLRCVSYFYSLPEKISWNSTISHKMHLQASSHGIHWAHFVSLFSVFIFETSQTAILSVHELAQSKERHFVFSFVSSDSPFMNILQFRDEGGASEWNVNGHDSWR